MIFRHSGISAPALCMSLISVALLQESTVRQAWAQQPAAPETPAQIQTNKKNPTVPDYPDPRSLSVELFYWVVIPSVGPDIQGGKLATGYSSLFALGKHKNAPGIDIRLPITRTGELRFEGFIDKGTGNQKAPQDTTIFGTSFSKGDYLSNQYQIQTGKLYLDDLLYPYKFPVSKLRFKSLWAVRYLRAKTTIDAPLSTAATTTTASSNRQVILPEFGAAVEYALTPHVLLRADASGFGLPHKSFIWDGNATVSYRRGQWSVEGGYKALGFKTSPNKDELINDILQGGFVGIRYNWK